MSTLAVVIAAVMSGIVGIFLFFSLIEKVIDSKKFTVYTSVLLSPFLLRTKHTNIWAMMSKRMHGLATQQRSAAQK